MTDVEVETIGLPPKKFTIETVETVYRKYDVEASDEETAKKRVRLFWSDPESLRAGLVTRLLAEEFSSRRIRSEKSAKKPS